MAMNFGGPRGLFPGPISAANSPSGRFRNMYQHSPPPNMSQQRGGYHKSETIKIPKPPKQPDKPLPAYMRYSRKVWEKVKTAHPEMKMWDIGKLIGEQWRNLPEDERQGYFAEYEVEKSEYQEAMKSYHNSTPYREWLKAKDKAQQALQEQQMMEKMVGQQMPKEEPRFQLQQVEDDDEDAEFAAKHLAAARFQRNHRLIGEIFSESGVPDSKSIVTKPRLENLKRQVQSLMQHQRKLESEIQDMEGKFEAKKKKIVQNNEDFEKRIKELSEPPPPLPSPKPEEEKKEEQMENEEETKNKENIENTSGEEQTMETDQDNEKKASMEEIEENETAAKETTENVKSPPQDESKNDAVSPSEEEKKPDDEKTEEKTSSPPDIKKDGEKKLEDQNATTSPKQVASETTHKEKREEAIEKK